MSTTPRTGQRRGVAVTRLLVIVLAMSLPAGACTASVGSSIQHAAYVGPLGDAAEQINCNAVVHDHCRTS